jgi:hypothetical protein
MCRFPHQKIKEHPFSRSYEVILPSSFNMVLSSTLVYSTCSPVSVRGTVRSPGGSPPNPKKKIKVGPHSVASKKIQQIVATQEIRQNEQPAAATKQLWHQIDPTTIVCPLNKFNCHRVTTARLFRRPPGEC